MYQMRTVQETAERIADKLLFISGINKPGNVLIPALVDDKSEIKAGSYCRSELVREILAVLMEDQTPITHEAYREELLKPDGYKTPT